MKRAVSVSLGSSTRDKAVETKLLGESIRLERIGTDGDMRRAAELLRALDGRVDCLGLGGADLAFRVDGHRYPLHSIRPLLAQLDQTPIVDGSGLKHTLEADLAQFLDEQLRAPVEPRRALIASGVDRWGMATSFEGAGYDCVFGDLMFAFGLPLALRSTRSLARLARLLIPLAGRLPFSWLYPTGEAQHRREPRWETTYRWATVLAGDCHYLKRHLPSELPGKIVVTNTTTEADVDLFKRAGIRTLVTSTPVLAGRSFGTNLIEAGLVAARGLGRPLKPPELARLLDELDLRPQLRDLTDGAP